MTSERLKFQGRLSERNRQAKLLERRLSGLRDSLRNHLDPFESVDELKGDLVAEEAVQFGSIQLEYIQILNEIKALKKALGMDERDDG